MKRKLMKMVICTLLAVALAAAPASAFASSKLALILKVDNDWARLRESTNSGSDVITRLRKGAKVLYWGDTEDQMCKVMTTKGEVGYIYKGYLSTYGAMKKSSVYITTGTTRLYKRSNSTLKSNGTLSSGKYVVVYKTYGDWAFIKTMSGKSAYCQTDTLRRAFS